MDTNNQEGTDPGEHLSSEESSNYVLVSIVEMDNGHDLDRQDDVRHQHQHPADYEESDSLYFFSHVHGENQLGD